MVKFSRWFIVVILTVIVTACGQQLGSGKDQTPLSTNKQNWQRYGVDDPRKLDYVDMHNNTRMEMSDSLTQMVKKLHRVSDAVVLRTDHNAYIGIKTDDTSTVNGSEVSDALRSKVILIVKTADSKLMNVYVSGKPEVYDTLHRYANKLQHGVTERSLMQSFNTRMKQQFPHSELGQ